MPSLFNVKTKTLILLKHHTLEWDTQHNHSELNEIRAYSIDSKLV